MSASRFFVPAGAGVAAIGGYMFYNSRKPALSREEQRREKSQSKRDAGITGAGVGQNAMTGLHEKGGPGSGVPTGNMDPDRAIKTDAPKDKLPSGGVGGGVGAGGANTRKTVDINAKKPNSGEGAGMFGSGPGQSSPNKTSTDEGDSSSGQDSSSGTGSSKSSSTTSNSSGPGQENRSWSQSLQGIFGQGGATAGSTDADHKKFHDTKIHSNHADTPTKRFPGETVTK